MIRIVSCKESPVIVSLDMQIFYAIVSINFAFTGYKKNLPWEEI